MPSKQIMVVLTELKFTEMLADIDVGKSDYLFDEIRAFIRKTRMEQQRVNLDIFEYRRNKIQPSYIKNGGAWYHRLTMYTSQLTRVRNKAIALRDGMK